jgi:hypothetical protein
MSLESLSHVPRYPKLTLIKTKRRKKTPLNFRHVYLSACTNLAAAERIFMGFYRVGDFSKIYWQAAVWAKIGLQ